VIRRHLYFGFLLLCVATSPVADAQENADGLTFRDVEFSTLLDSDMRLPLEVVVSPDGDDVYVSSIDSRNIHQFARNGDGSLDPLGSVDVSLQDGGAGRQGSGLFVSRNGRFVYASAWGNLDPGGIVRFNRDNAGQLSFGAALPSDGVVIPGLHSPTHLAQSPDGKHLYAVNTGYILDPYYPPAVAVVSLNQNTGAMTFVQSIDRPEGNVLADVSISPDGRHVYVANQTLATIEVYSRNATTGELTPENSARSRGDAVTSVESIVISPDGMHAYTTHYSDARVSVLNRDADTGALTHRSDGIIHLSGASRVAITPDGNRIVVVAAGNGFSFPTRVAVYERDPETGLLEQLEMISDQITGFPVLLNPTAPNISPDGETYYVPGGSSGSVAAFAFTRPELPCEHFPMILDEYEAFAEAYDLYGDIDLDGLPELASITLIEEAGCTTLNDSFDEAITNAYLVNLAGAETEEEVYISGEWVLYRHALAALQMISSDLGDAVNEALAPFDVEMHFYYTSVSCSGDDVCEPSDARAADEPFSGEGDPDADGFTNAQEWANVLARGGDVEEFAVSALDPLNDGSLEVSSGGGGGGGCFIATAAYGTPLAAELEPLREFRDTRMLTNPVGAAFADAYYRLSPPVAGFMAEHPRMRAIARTLLAPIVEFTAGE